MWDDAGLDGGVIGEALAQREVRARQDHARLLAADTSLWPPPGEVTGAWLGWLSSLERADGHLERILPMVQEIVEEGGVSHVVLVGMGGSSLFPLVLRGACGSAPGHPELHVLDSTDPAAVARVEAAVDWQRTLVVAASKSGTTIETLAHLDRFVARLEQAVGERSRSRVVVITDPGSSLEQRADAEGMRAVVSGDPDVGGRYSALSPFGLLPAALLGIDVGGLLDVARAAAGGWRADPWGGAGPARLAALMACGVEHGRDALHLIVDRRAGLLGAWIEQLVAESTGKDGTGVLPVVVAGVDEVAASERAIVVALGAVEGLDALAARGVPTVMIPFSGPEQLGAEALRWMQAVPLACAQLGVDPFDQPDVASAKAATAAALAGGVEPDLPVPLATLDEPLAEAGYVGMLAYIDPEGLEAARVEAAARALASRHAMPVTVGFGPRYLHSTGQLHKGGRDDGLFLVVVGDDPTDVPIPGREYGFSRLKRAQAAGDLAALRAGGRRAVRVTLDDPLLAP